MVPEDVFFVYLKVFDEFDREKNKSGSDWQNMELGPDQESDTQLCKISQLWAAPAMPHYGDYLITFRRLFWPCLAI